ncbi:MAG: biotin/lipoyl-containing protein [Woeseiaceae bacterium]|nr:biotin/lipoyl-containing protein [Woeseiaceae bacterium]
MNLTDKDVREILKLLDESGYDELKIETDSFNITLRQSAGPGAEPVPGSESSGGDAGKRRAETAASPSDTGGDDIRDIYPPLPGTFYRAPSPGAQPFVDVGSPVSEDTVVGLVETMKLMNSVMAGCTGEVIEICQENGAMIEAHDVLLRIREGRA